MTRFARFGVRNKKAHDATKWADLKGDGQQRTDNSENKEISPSDKQKRQPSDKVNKSDPDSSLKKIQSDKKFKPDKNVNKKHHMKFDVKKGKKFTFNTGKFASKTRDYSELECYNCKQKGHKASDCTQPSDGKHLEFQCFNCKEQGHKAFQCPKKKDAYTHTKFDRKSQKSFAKVDKSAKNWKEIRSEKRRLKRQSDVQQKKQCFNCREAGHQLSECPELKKDVEQGTGICFKCGSTEHFVNKCHVKLAPGEFPYAKCFICGETGHLSSQCPDNPRGLYPNGGCCRECGSVEHLRRDCPVFQKQQGIDSVTLERISEDVKSADADDAVMKRKSDATDIPMERKPKKPKVVKF